LDKSPLKQPSPPPSLPLIHSPRSDYAPSSSARLPCLLFLRREQSSSTCTCTARRGAAGGSRAAARARHGGERPAGVAAPRGGERPPAGGSSSPARRETGGPKNPGREEVVSRGERSRGGQIDVLTYDCEERRGAAARCGGRPAEVLLPPRSPPTPLGEAVALRLALRRA